ncbi:MAG: M20 family metallopeptidase [Candidatus Kariarchaeaceae archaeon]|jgi:aminobenzoyl-glutamate utilization protein B
MAKDRILSWIEENQTTFIEMSDKIWDLSETGLQEYKSVKYLTDIFKSEGFAVETGVAEMPTAFTATYGVGSPIIGILGEYDALPGLSQKPVPYRKPVKEGANGQGCNHNLLGVAGVTAAFAIKKEIEKGTLKGTIRYYGCPAEETYNAKGWMILQGSFDDVDIGLTWHPSSYNANWEFSTNAMNTVIFKFHGVTAHAARDPHNGRSALDAVELMNVGVNYLREHMIPDARIHYVITSGGEAPNVVPAFAESHYFIRAPKRYQVDELHERVVKIAKGAAMMTETDLEIDFLSGTYNTSENKVIGEVISKNMHEIGPAAWSSEDIEFARELQKSLSKNAFEGVAKLIPAEYVERLLSQPLCDIILPNVGENQILTASTDVSDVSWVLPLAQFCTATQVMASPGHSWQNVACGKMGIGHKGMILAAKVLATTAFDFMMDQNLVNTAKDEFKRTHKDDKYKSPFPDGHKPPFHRLKEDHLQYP